MDKELTMEDLDKDIGFTASPQEEEAQTPKEESPIESQQPSEIEQPLEMEQPSKTETPKETSENINFVAMRKIKEKLERENRELAEQLKRHAEQVKQEEKSKKQEISESNYDFSEDDLIEGKHLKSILNEVSSLKKELSQYRQQDQASRVEMKLKAEYPDIEKVVTKENLELLSAAYPHIGESLRNDSNVYTQLSSAYTLIKNFGIGEQKEQTKTIKENLAAPKTSKSTNARVTALDGAYKYTRGMTEKDKEYHRKQLLHALQYGED